MCTALDLVEQLGSRFDVDECIYIYISDTDEHCFNRSLKISFISSLKAVSSIQVNLKEA